MTDSLQREIQTLRELHGSERDPHGRAFAPLADALRRAGHVRESLATLLTGLQEHPDFTSGHVVAARTYLDAGMVAEAELSAHRVLELDGENVEGLRLLALAQQAQGADLEARRTRRRLRELEGPAETEAREGWPDPEDESDEEVASMDELAPDVPTAEDAPEDDQGVVEPGQTGVEDDDFVELSALAPDTGSDEVPTGAETPEPEPVDLGALAPDEPEPVDLGALAPDEPEPVDLDALAPDEPEPVALDALAPDDPEPVHLDALAPDDPGDQEATEKTFVSVSAPAPDPAADEEADDRRTDEQGSANDPDADPHAPLPTRTLADLYARQGMTDRALSVYRQLLRVTPEDPALRDRIAGLEGQADDAADAGGSITTDRTEVAGDVSSIPSLEDADQDEAVASAIGWGPKDGAHGPTVDTPFAWTQDDPDAAAAAGPPIGDYFDRLLAWGREDDETRDVGDGP